MLTVLESEGRAAGPPAGLVGVIAGGFGEVVDDWEVGRVVDAVDGVVRGGVGVGVVTLGVVCVFVVGLVLVFCARAPLESREAANTAEASSDRFNERRADPIVMVDYRAVLPR